MKISEYFTSSIGRKQIVAVTGLMLVLFLVGHLAGNLFFYGGPEAFNAYAKKLADMRPALLVVEFGLLLVFLIHIFFTAKLVAENRKARGSLRYQGGKAKGQRSWATRLMPITGTILIFFVVKHLLDFTFADHHGAMSVLKGENLGLYGLVFNTFLNPFESLFYIIAMFCVGFHLSHGVQSVSQSFGYASNAKLKSISVGLGLLIAGGFSSIPIYVMLMCGYKGF